MPAHRSQAGRARPTRPAGRRARGRRDPEEAEDSGPRTVIAGYPWFTDWGRDTMIALPGLTLATGRPQAAAGLLRTFARYVDQGQVPNLFPDAGTAPEYNTVDATLWYFHAVDAYVTATGDTDLARELWPLLEDIVRWHVRGTRYGIHVDPADGLLHAGRAGRPVDLDGREGGRLGGDAAPGQAGGDPGALVSRAAHHGPPGREAGDRAARPAQAPPPAQSRPAAPRPGST